MASLSVSNLSPRTQLIVVCVITVGLCAAVYVNWLGPLYQEVVALDQEVVALEAQVEEGRLIQAQLPVFKRELEEQTARLEQLRRVLPEEKETPQMIRAIQELAQASSLKIKSFTPQKTVQNDFYLDWPIEITMEGNYNNLGLFFERISEYQRVINVTNLNVKASEEPLRDIRTIQAECTATTFVLPDSAEESAAPRQMTSKQGF